jgi:hypothetical protein
LHKAVVANYTSLHKRTTTAETKPIALKEKSFMFRNKASNQKLHHARAHIYGPPFITAAAAVHSCFCFGS